MKNFLTVLVCVCVSLSQCAIQGVSGFFAVGPKLGRLEDDEEGSELLSVMIEPSKPLRSYTDAEQRLLGLDGVYKATGMTHRLHAGESIIWMRYPTPAGIARALEYKGLVGMPVQLVEI
ncbi:hypothetical protein HBO34_32195 [Pseudomonas veronii]|jgi:hypothetical protein|uniref:hypothetical protein n=1 Tax=Pseudomonas TaxID=286 RepID=UPI0011F2ACCE|nr:MULTISPECIES: hypothetical protein [Pseudomonas]KAA0941854.1 hypothetical protein FQ182_28390 [Pseudomonas sp. ANT_H4]MBJ2181731.1 hypothetical protein [Pseudomonas veronii]NMX42501.1 hypothetical protein [Pseudomonas veronii]NMX54079.1 hypothetical protein [Pseudomonas veronii]NWD58784.1 hypothetical protein [Pseudomonas veronii]